MVWNGAASAQGDHPGKACVILALVTLSAGLEKLKFTRRPSIRPSSIRLWHQLSLNLLHWFLSKFSCYCPGPYGQRFLNFWNTNVFFLFFTKFFVFVNVGPYGSKNFKTLLLLQITFASFQTFSDFFLNGLQKRAVLYFWNFVFTIFRHFFSFSSTWDSIGTKTSKHYCSLKSL